MSKFIKSSQAEKEQARTTDLAELLTAQGEEVKKWAQNMCGWTAVSR